MIIQRKTQFQKNLSELPAEFQEAASQFGNYIAFQQRYDAAIKEVSTKLEILDDEFRVRYRHNPIHHLECRLKSVPSLLEKLKRKGLPLTLEAAMKNLTDIAGIRVICCYVDDIYRIADLLLRQTDVELLRRTDYIAEPKSNGYRSLHLVVQIPIFLSERTEFVPVEIQIRTEAMDFWASLEHQLRYKTDQSVSPELCDMLKNCAEDINDVELRMQKIHQTLNELE